MLISMIHLCPRNSYCDRELILIYAPIKHRQIFLTVRRGEINEIRDIRQQWDVEVAKVSHVRHRGERAPQHEYRGRIVVDAEVLRKLVISTLNE